MDQDSSEDNGIVGAEHLGALLPFLRESVLVFDRHGNLTARVGPPGGILGHALQAGQNVFARLHPDDVPRGIRIGDEARASQDGWVGRISVRLRHADGSWRRYSFEIHNRHGDPAIRGMVAVIREEEPEHAPEAPPADEQGDALDDLVAIAHGLPTAYLVLDAGRIVRHASDAVTDLLRCSRDDLLGMPVDELVTEHDRPLVRAAVGALAHTPGTRTVICATRARFGSRLLEAEFHTRGTDAAHKLTTVVLVDHTTEPELVRLATRDALTGLHNRAKVIDTITGLLLEPEPVLSVVYVDLDDLKAINDAHGHETGDQALVEAADRIRALVRPEDLVGRMGGDEFVVVCPGLAGTGLMSLVERLGDTKVLHSTVPAPDGTALPLTVSAGGATAVATDTTSTLLARADEAMFRAKHARTQRE